VNESAEAAPTADPGPASPDDASATTVGDEPAPSADLPAAAEATEATPEDTSPESSDTESSDTESSDTEATGTTTEATGTTTEAASEATAAVTVAEAADEEPEDEPGGGGRSRLVRWTPWIIAGLFFVAYSALSLIRYWRMGFQSPDVTVFEQAIRNYAHFRAPIVDIKGPDFNHLGDHFHPLMVLMAPLYRLIPDPGTLLVQQSFLFALSIVPVARLAMRRLGTASGVCLGLAYVLSWGLQNAVNFDFHEICFGVPIMAFSLEAFLDRRWRACAVWALLLLLVKEDLGITVAVIGFLLFIRRQRLLGAAVSASGIAAFFLIIFVVIPHFNPEGKYPYLEQGGGTDVTPWGLLLEMVDNRTKIWTLIFLFGITAFLALGSPLTLLVLPTIVWRFHSTNDAYWGRDWHYSAILMPIVFLAMLDVLTRMKGARRDWIRAYALRVPAVVLTIAVMLVSVAALIAAWGRVPAVVWWFAAILMATVLLSDGIMHSRPRLLLPAVILMLPWGLWVVDRLPRWGSALAGVAWVVFGAWYSAYMLAVFDWAI